MSNFNKTMTNTMTMIMMTLFFCSATEINTYDIYKYTSNKERPRKNLRGSDPVHHSNLRRLGATKCEKY